jgi:HK97 family phage major capsid protein
VQTDTWDPADPDSLLDAIGLAVAAEVIPNRWFVNGADFTVLRKVKEASGSAKYVLESDLTRDATYRLFGIPVTVTNKVDEGTAVLAESTWRSPATWHPRSLSSTSGTPNTT